MNEAEFVALLIRNAVKPPLMLADAYPSDCAKLTYRIRKTQVQSSHVRVVKILILAKDSRC